MLSLVLTMVLGLKDAVKEEVAKKIGNKELAPNLLKVVNFVFVLIQVIFKSKESGVKEMLIKKIPVLMALLGAILADLADKDNETTNLSDIDFELLD